jgi:homoserine acetyltransferase
MSSDGYYTEEVHGPHEYLDLGNFELASGFVLPQAKLAYKTIGTLNEAKDNAILLPHMYTGTAAFMTALAAANPANLSNTGRTKLASAPAHEERTFSP